MLEVLVIILVIAPLAPLLPIQHWGMRFFDFVRLQTLTLQIITLLTVLYLWETPSYLQWVLILSLCICAVYQVIIIYPYTPLYHRVKLKKEYYPQRLKLITANVLQTNTSYTKFINEIKRLDPHIFITMESDINWDAAVSKALPSYSYNAKASLSNFYGMHLYSKVPLDKTQINYLVEKNVPSIHVNLTHQGHEIQLIAIHPAPPSPTENETSKERDAELMIVGKICRRSNISTVVCGDLNDVAWSPTSRLFRKMTGFLDPRLGKGLYPTFHARYWLLRFPLDHLFYSKDLDVPILKRLRRFGSDHFGMYYEINIPRTEIDVSNPSLSKKEHSEVDTFIVEGLEEASTS